MNASAIWTEFRSSVAGYFARRGVPANDVEDCVQEVFLRVHKALPSLRDEERIGPWLFRIARNILVDRLRGRADPEPPLEDESALPDSMRQNSMRQCVVGMVDALDEPYRSALHAVELDGESQADVARRLGISYTGLKSRVQRGREKLRAAFDACCAVEWGGDGTPSCEP